MQSFGVLGIAAYCPRQLWYHRRADDAPDRAEDARALALSYDRLRAQQISGERLAVTPETAARNLDRVVERFPALWPHLEDPNQTDVFVTGRDARGEVAKLLATDPPVPTLVSNAAPPEDGVWQPQAVRATAAALAVAWETNQRVERTVLEYPRHGRVRSVAVTARRRATYRRVLRIAETMDGPPQRIDDAAKCDACTYQEECGVRSRSLSSLL